MILCLMVASDFITSERQCHRSKLVRDSRGVMRRRPVIRVISARLKRLRFCRHRPASALDRSPAAHETHPSDTGSHHVTVCL